jgi:hypothetical protein
MESYSENFSFEILFCLNGKNFSGSAKETAPAVRGIPLADTVS